MALTVWGFLGDAAPDLIAFRQPLFAEVANPHHYPEQRRIVDIVPDECCARPPSRWPTPTASTGAASCRSERSAVRRTTSREAPSGIAAGVARRVAPVEQLADQLAPVS